jgi:hypothetical protein
MVWLRELTLLGKVALLEVPPLPAEIGLLGRGGSASRCSLVRRDDSNQVSLLSWQRRIEVYLLEEVAVLGE